MSTARRKGGARPSAPRPGRAAWRPRATWLLLLAPLFAYGVVRLRGRSPASPAPPLVAEAPRVPTETSFGAGAGTLYDATWRVDTRISIPQMDAKSTQVELTGVAQVVELGPDGSRRLVGVRLRELASLTVTALGEPLFPSLEAAREQLVLEPVLLALGPSGAVEELYLPAAATPLAKNLLSAFALHFAVTSSAAPGDAGYGVTEVGDFGRALWHYQPGRDRLTKEARDPQVSGRGEVRFSGALPIDLSSSLSLQPGAPREGASHTGEGRASFHAAKREQQGDVMARPDLAHFEHHAPEERPSDLGEQASDAAMAQGLTVSELLAMVAAHGIGRPPPKGSIMRATAFLRATPGACKALEGAFPSAPPASRELIIDLLSSSGDSTAQASMRTLLATAAARETPKLFEKLVQRFGLVDKPTAESILFVRAEWESAKKANDDARRQASVYTLGSLAHHAARSGDERLATPIVELLLRELASARELRDERGLLAALGNTGLPGALEPILARVTSKDQRLRTQAAVSLRKFDRPEVRLALAKLGADAELQVAQSALRSLDTQNPGTPELTVLADAAERSDFNIAIDSALVSFVTSHPVDRVQATRILLAIEGRVGDRVQLQQQVEAGLKSLEPLGGGAAGGEDNLAAPSSATR